MKAKQDSKSQKMDTESKQKGYVYSLERQITRIGKIVWTAAELCVVLHNWYLKEVPRTEITQGRVACCSGRSRNAKSFC